MRNCPFCEWEISNTAKKCKHCWEWVVEKEIKITEEDEDDVPYTSEKTKKSTPKNKKNHDWDGQSKISKFISDNFVFIIIWVIVIFFMAKSLLKDSNKQWNYIDEEVDETIESSEMIDDETNFNLKWSSKDINKIIISTDYWYKLFPNTVWECEIKWEREIKAFVDAVNKADEWNIIDWTCPNQYVKWDIAWWKNIGILFDNAYSKNQNWEINEIWPDQRIALLWDYMRENKLLDWSKIDLTYMFTIIPNDNSEEPDDNTYTFTIDSSAFPITYIKDKWWNNIRYIDWRYFLNFDDTEISYTFSWIKEKDNKCISQSVNSYICYDAESVYQKIKNIYDTNYDKDEKHTNNMLVKTLATKNNRFSGLWKKDEIYIITNWEFKIWYEWEVKYLSNLKQKYKNIWKHDAWADKTHNLTDFNMIYANWYQKDSKYESFWSDAIEVLRPQLPLCDDIIIHVIWLANSAEFKPLAENVYKQIFNPCNVSFK